jgi:hypothetical protein
MSDQVRHRTVIDDKEFDLRVWLGQNGHASHVMGTSEVTLSAEKSFTPYTIDPQGDTRTLSYRIKRLALVDAQGHQQILYTNRIHWMFAMALPVISLIKSLMLNHRLHGKELWCTVSSLWGELARTSFKR